jgi:hypothetical protein
MARKALDVYTPLRCTRRWRRWFSGWRNILSMRPMNRSHCTQISCFDFACARMQWWRDWMNSPFRNLPTSCHWARSVFFFIPSCANRPHQTLSKGYWVRFLCHARILIASSGVLSSYLHVFSRVGCMARVLSIRCDPCVHMHCRA